MLVAASAAASSELELAADLYAEGQWAAARVEGLRVQAAAAGPAADRAGLLAAVSALRLGTDRTAALQDLEALWRAESADLESRCLAAYEFGLADWAAGARRRPPPWNSRTCAPGRRRCSGAPGARSISF